MFFGNGIDRRTLYIILGVLVVISLVNAGSGFWIETLLTLPAVVIAISFHEYAHAYAADKFGDTTPRATRKTYFKSNGSLGPFWIYIAFICRCWLGKTSND